MKSPRDDMGARPWYREPLMWLVVALPAAAVAAATVTLVLAARGADEVVRDDFRREGLAIHADPTRDAAAVAAGAHATLAVESARGRIRATVTLAQGPVPGSLLVLLSHATRAEYDRMVTLPGRDGHYQGDIGALPPGRWFVEITPPDRRWRLRGDFRDDVTALELAPGVS